MCLPLNHIMNNISHAEQYKNKISQCNSSYNIKEEGNPGPETGVCFYKRCLMGKPESCSICKKNAS